MWQQLLQQLVKGDIKALARSITFIENEQLEYERFLEELPVNTNAKIIGITGPPGAGKSTLVDGVIKELVRDGSKVAILCVDPSSPFNFGALLGDRIRMSRWYTHPNVYIRSLATRGSMGGLHPKIIEITELVKAAQFDYIIVETVGVGQSEIEIAGLADVTVVVLVPEAGDEVQTMKAGLMEIADVFVVNKSDRPEADTFIRNLQLMLAPAFSVKQKEIPIIKTVASQHIGISDLVEIIQKQELNTSDKKLWLLAEKIYLLIQKERMKNVSKEKIVSFLKSPETETGLNTYQLFQLLMKS